MAADTTVFYDPNSNVLPSRVQKDNSFPSDISIITDPTNAAKKVLSIKAVANHHTTNSGDSAADTPPFGKNRVETMWGSPEGVTPANGDIRAFTIEALIPASSFVDTNQTGALHFSQTLSLGTGGPTSLNAGMTADSVAVRMGNTTFFTRSAFDAAERGKWHVYTAVIKFSTTTSGYVEQWLDGNLVATKTGIVTLVRTTAGDFYYKFGAYRQQTTTNMATSEVLYRGFKYAPTRALSESFTLMASGGGGTTTPPPVVKPVVNLTDQGSGNVLVNWPDDGAARQFRVFRGGTVRATLTGSPPVSNWQDTGRVVGATYTYAVEVSDLATPTPNVMTSDDVSVTIASTTTPTPPDTTPPPAPTITPSGGTYAAGGTATVTLADSESGVSIYYNTAPVPSVPADPTAADTLYTAPFALNSSVNLKARAFDDSGNASAATSATFTIPAAVPPSAPVPTGNPQPSPSGAYLASRSVKFSETDPDVDIRFTFAAGLNRPEDPTVDDEALEPGAAVVALEPGILRAAAFGVGGRSDVVDVLVL